MGSCPGLLGDVVGNAAATVGNVSAAVVDPDVATD